MEFLKSVGDWAISPVGAAILAIVALTGFSIWKFWLKLNQLLLKIVGPFFRSLKKEPQRLIAKMYLYPQALSDDGLSLIGVLERKQSDPIIYPTVKFETSDNSLVLNDCVPPMSDRRMMFQIATIKHEEIEKLKTEGVKIKAKFSCVDDLIEAKVNLCEIDLEEAINLHEMESLLEVKKILISVGENEAGGLDSFDEIVANLDSRHPPKDNAPIDVFRFLLKLRKAKRKFLEGKY